VWHTTKVLIWWLTPRTLKLWGEKYEETIVSNFICYCI